MPSTEDPFYASIAPVRDSVSELIDAAQPSPDLPDAQSRAMRELAIEEEFTGCWVAEPVRHAHTVAMWKRHLAVDCAEAMIRDLHTDPAPVFAYIVLARAVLENAAGAARLLDPDIGIRLRIARGRNERIHSHKETLRLHWLPQTQRDHARATMRTIRKTAETLEFEIVDGWISEKRPSFTALLRWVLGDELGGSLANLYSAVAHGTQYGLTTGVIAVTALSLTQPVARVAVGPSSRDVNLAVGATGMALIATFEAERVLMGRRWSGWETARRKTQSTLEAAFAAV